MSREEFIKNNLRQWDIMLNGIFNGNIPEQWIWDNNEDIIDICNIIGADHNLNHTFFPTGGGLDLSGAGTSFEPYCIELYFDSAGTASIIKPDILIFQSFGAPYEWAYFRIETHLLRQSGVYENFHSIKEELLEITPGNYVDRCWWDAGYFGHDEVGAELPLPDDARVITRHLQGSFVIFAKGSIYNAIPDTYDGRHTKMTAAEFRKYIRKFFEANK